MAPLDQLVIDRTVLHYVETTKDSDDPTLLLTDQEIDLDDELRGFFRSKLIERLDQKGLDVVVDGDLPQVVPKAVSSVLVDQDRLVGESRIVAQHLFETQTKSNSSGLLAVIFCTRSTDGAGCIALVKLERQRGVSFAIDEETGRVDLELLRNLTLTDKTKVYKTALFAVDGHGDLTGLVADDQRSTAKGSPVASFFLRQFLGCKPKTPASMVTYRFVEAATRAIAAMSVSAETRGRYQVGLLSTVQDHSTDIRPRTFASRILDEAHRAQFLEAVEQAGIDPGRSFEKDTSRVSVRQFQVTFDSGMVLVGPPDSWQKVVMPDRPSAEEPVQLEDTVQSVLTSR